MEEQDSKNKKEPESVGDVTYEKEDEGEGTDIQKLRQKLKECRLQKQDYLAGWQRTQADFINYRRRQEEQLAEWSKMLGEGLISDILPVLDSLAAAQKSQPENEGLVTLRNQLQAILKRHGLEEIKSVGEKFNPEWHEVVEYEEGDNSHKNEIVTEEIQKGYMLNGKVIRVAKVKVTKK